MSALSHVVITGVASGIGRATALALREQGHRITGIDRNDPGADVDTWMPFDLDNADAALPELDAPIDVLINAAGLPPRDGTQAKVLRVNFLSLRRITLHLLPMLSDGAAIVNVASKAGARWRKNMDQVRRLMAQPDVARLDGFVRDEAIDAVRAYDLSKEAVVVWTKAMTAPLLTRGLRMNCVSPAAVDTPILNDFVTAFGPRASGGIELTGRAGTPQEVAAIIAFLASPKAGWVRGCNIETDGGLTAILETESVIGADLMQAEHILVRGG